MGKRNQEIEKLNKRVDGVLKLLEPYARRIAENMTGVESLRQRIEGLEERIARLEALHMHPKHSVDGLIPQWKSPQDVCQ